MLQQIACCTRTCEHLEMTTPHQQAADSPAQDLSFNTFHVGRVSSGLGMLLSRRFMLLSFCVQAGGSRSGMYFDPSTGQPLINHPGVKCAMEVFAALHALGPQSEPLSSTCTSNARLFASGRCAVYLGENFGWKQAAHNSSAVAGRVGVANVPGGCCCALT